MTTDYMAGPYILMYHAIADDADDPYSVSVRAFREQLSWLFEHGFEVVPLSFLVRSLQAMEHRKLRKKVVITFDDGYEDFVANALPVLLGHQAPATVFLVTGMLGGRASWNEADSQAPLMSEDEVRHIKAKGISLGSHTATHVDLTRVSHDELHRELMDSHAALARLGETFYAFSYPWGQWTGEVMRAVKAAGYECALAVGERSRLTAANSYCLPRITMARSIGLERFQSLLTRTRWAMEIRRGYRVARESLLSARLKFS